MTPEVVVKVGGSLLDWPPLPARLTAFLEGLGDVRPIVVVGGGRMVDALRDLDAIHGLGESRSHALALQILDVSAEILVAMTPGTVLARRLDDLDRSRAVGRIPVLAPRLVLDDDDTLGGVDALPHAWSVTSDSIAARIATMVGAVELILLKSAPPPLDLATVVEEGRIDRHFPEASRRVSRRTYVDFRRDRPISVSL